MLADLKAQCSAIDGSCQVEMSTPPAATTTVVKKRADAAPTASAYVVVGCEKTDATCELAVNTMLAGAVDADTDVSVTETSADEVNNSLPTFPDGKIVFLFVFCFKKLFNLSYLLIRNV